VIGALIVACGGSGDDTASTDTTAPPTTSTSLRLAVVGDSIPFNAPDDCENCVGFVNQFQEAAAESTGRTVTVDNFSRHDGAGIDDLASQLETHQQLTTALEGADIVIVSIGFNDMPPWPADGPCGGRGPDVPIDQAAADIATYTPDCIAATMAGQQEGLASIYETIAGLRGDLPTAFIALNVYSNIPGNPDLAILGAPERQRVEDVGVQVHDAWNEATCATADDAGFECIDLYHAFNGADGRSPLGDLVGPDYTHPSQEGNDAIAALLADVDLSALSG
jgi:lysophospholipase L1-like esterase